MFYVISSIAIILIILFGGLLPTRISMNKRGEWFIKMGNIFSGGVFLGSGIMHLMPEAQEMFAEIAPESEYPWAFLLAGVGFLLVLFIEKVLMRGEDVGRLSRELSTRELRSIIAEIDNQGHQSHYGGSHSHAPMPTANKLVGIQQAYPFILTLVLSVHSLIAGVALGLAEDVAASLALLVAIVAHKGFEAFALGVSLKEAAFSNQYLSAVIGFYALMTPLGIAAGVAFASLFASDTSAQLQAVFNALAGGTFLYVGVVEIIDEAFEKRGQNRQQFVFLVLGFVFMAVLALWA